MIKTLMKIVLNKVTEEWTRINGIIIRHMSLNLCKTNIEIPVLK